jgi:hypothetical protein
LNEDKVRGAGGGQIANRRQGSILTCATLGIPRDRPGVGLNDAIAIRERLDGFVVHSCGIGRALNWSRRPFLNAPRHRARRTSALEHYVSAFLRECTE